MPRPLKFALIAFAALLGLLIVAIAVVALTFDPNDYRDELSALVKDKTGRELKIDGKIGLSVFPWIGAEIGRTTLSNAAGFGDAPFAAIESADIKVKLLPLLRGSIEARAIKLDGLKLHLATDRGGRPNWADLGAADSTPTTESPASGSGAIASVAIGGLSITNADVSFRDDQDGSQYALRNLQLETGALSPGTPADVTLRAQLESSAQKLSTPISLDARLGFDLDKMAATVEHGTFSAVGLTLNVRDLKATQLDTAWRLAGALDVAPFNPRDLMKTFAVAYQPADAAALTKISLAAQLDASGQTITLADLKMNLDGTNVTGKLTARDLDALRYEFDLRLDSLNLDRYLPAATAATAQRSWLVPDAVAADAPPDLSALRTLRAQGDVSITQLTAYGMAMTDFAASLKADGGVIDIAPRTKLYGGNTHGTLRLDARPATPEIGIRQSLSALQIAPFLKALQLTDKLSGIGALELDLKARGLDATAIRRSLSGVARFGLNDGAIDGADFMKIVNDARTMYDQYKGRPPEPQTGKTDRTVFQLFNGSFNIAQGVAKTGDIKLQSSKLAATGAGSVDLATEGLDLTFQITPARSEGKRTVTVPVTVSGPFTAPRYSVDLAAVAKGAAREQLDEKKEEVKQKLDEKLQEGLERLFRR